MTGRRASRTPAAGYLCLLFMLAAAYTAIGWAHSATLAIRNVTVVPMDRERLLPGRTVLIRDGRIVGMGSVSGTSIPAGAEIVDGSGRYLIPGLADMHVHLSPDTGVSAARNRRRLALMIAHGVTTARSMLGHPSHLALRDSVEAGRTTGPRLLLASPQVTGPEATGYFAQFAVHNADQARERVATYAREGYDFLKITFGWTPELYDVVAREARAARLPLTGHVSSGIDLGRVLAAGQQVEHLDGYLEAAVPHDASIRTIESQGAPGGILQSVRSDLMRRAAVATANAGVYNTPTLALFRIAFIDSLGEADLTALPDLAYFPPASVTAMLAQRSAFFTEGPPAAEREALGRFRDAMVRELGRAGAKLMVGSDAPQQFMMVGFATHREMHALQDAGLSAYQALSAATRVPAEYLGEGQTGGRVRVGARADLVLLAANPLADIRNSERITGVVHRGRWLSRAALDTMLAAAREQP